MAATNGMTSRPAEAAENTTILYPGELPTIESIPGPLLTTTLTPSAAPPKPTPKPAAVSNASALASDGIPVTALDAYKNAAARERRRSPECGLTWPLLAGIGRVESDHGRFADAVLHTDGVSTPRIIGIALNGAGTAEILDTDGGRLDGDTVYDRAVGPMQFIPSTWASYGVDGNDDGVKDPNNIFDEALAAADYLCAAGGDLTTLAGQTRAVLAYNHSDEYLTLVLKLEGIYARGVPGLTVPVLPTTGAPPRVKPRSKVPPVNPGPKLGTFVPVKPPTPTRRRTTTPSAPSTAPSTASPASPTAPPVATSPPAVSDPAPPPVVDPAPVPVDPIPSPITTPPASTAPVDPTAAPVPAPIASDPLAPPPVPTAVP